MAAFFTDLVSSIFTPGPTPTLVVATNVSFAALQLVLLLLLIATYSIHFFILSFLSAALWYAINWFVAELNIARALEEQKKRENADKADTESDGETIIDSGIVGSGSNVVEAQDRSGELKRTGASASMAKSEISTEDEWERVSEDEKSK